MIEGVEHIHTEFQQVTFPVRHHESLPQRQVPILPSEIGKGIARHIAIGKRRTTVDGVQRDDVAELIWIAGCAGVPIDQLSAAIILANTGDASRAPGIAGSL